MWYVVHQQERKDRFEGRYETHVGPKKNVRAEASTKKTIPAWYSAGRLL